MFKRTVSTVVLLTFLASAILPANLSFAQGVSDLPQPGAMVNLSPAFTPALIKGITLDKENPFKFGFILDAGDTTHTQDDIKQESDKLIKYFLAALTVPEKDLWVNLSPYEKDKMLAANLAQTGMGQDMLAQDYLLKQITASLIYPEKSLGKEFWQKVYAKAQSQFGTSEVPVNTFNKVWIVADKADVYEKGQSAFIIGGHLKVMLESDYLAMNKAAGPAPSVSPSSSLSLRATGIPSVGSPAAGNIASQIIREIIIPELEREVNQGKNFAPLRQMFYSMILASWFKTALKDALVAKLYGNQSKVNVGVNTDDPTQVNQIYDQYLKAYKKGVFNYIKEEPQAEGTTTPRKYFSGGLKILPDPAMIGRHTDTVSAQAVAQGIKGKVFTVDTAMSVPTFDTAMAVPSISSIIGEITKRAGILVGNNWPQEFFRLWWDSTKHKFSKVQGAEARTYINELRRNYEFIKNSAGLISIEGVRQGEKLLRSHAIFIDTTSKSVIDIDQFEEAINWIDVIRLFDNDLVIVVIHPQKGDDKQPPSSSDDPGVREPRPNSPSPLVTKNVLKLPSSAPDAAMQVNASIDFGGKQYNNAQVIKDLLYNLNILSTRLKQYIDLPQKSSAEIIREGFLETQITTIKTSNLATSPKTAAEKALEFIWNLGLSSDAFKGTPVDPFVNEYGIKVRDGKVILDVPATGADTSKELLNKAQVILFRINQDRLKIEQVLKVLSSDTAMTGSKKPLAKTIRVSVDKKQILTLGGGSLDKEDFPLRDVLNSTSMMLTYLTEYNNGKAFREKLNDGEGVVLGIVGTIQLGDKYAGILKHLIAQLPYSERVYVQEVRTLNPFAEKTFEITLAVLGLKGEHQAKHLDILEQDINTLVKRLKQDADAAMLASTSKDREQTLTAIRLLRGAMSKTPKVWKPVQKGGVGGPIYAYYTYDIDTVKSTMTVQEIHQRLKAVTELFFPVREKTSDDFVWVTDPSLGDFAKPKWEDYRPQVTISTGILDTNEKLEEYKLRFERHLLELENTVRQSIPFDAAMTSNIVLNQKIWQDFVDNVLPQEGVRMPDALKEHFEGLKKATTFKQLISELIKIRKDAEQAASTDELSRYFKQSEFAFDRNLTHIANFIKFSLRYIKEKMSDEDVRFVEEIIDEVVDAGSGLELFGKLLSFNSATFEQINRMADKAESDTAMTAVVSRTVLRKAEKAGLNSAEILRRFDDQGGKGDLLEFFKTQTADARTQQVLHENATLAVGNKTVKAVNVSTIVRVLKEQDFKEENILPGLTPQAREITGGATTIALTHVRSTKEFNKQGLSSARAAVLTDLKDYMIDNGFNSFNVIVKVEGFWATWQNSAGMTKKVLNAMNTWADQLKKRADAAMTAEQSFTSLNDMADQEKSQPNSIIGKTFNIFTDEGVVTMLVTGLSAENIAGIEEERNEQIIIEQEDFNGATLNDQAMTVDEINDLIKNPQSRTDERIEVREIAGAQTIEKRLTGQSYLALLDNFYIQDIPDGEINPVTKRTLLGKLKTVQNPRLLIIRNDKFVFSKKNVAAVLVYENTTMQDKAMSSEGEALVALLKTPRIAKEQEPDSLRLRPMIALHGLTDTPHMQYLLRQIDNNFGLKLGRNQDNQPRLYHINIDAMPGFLETVAQDAAKWLTIADAAMIAQEQKPWVQGGIDLNAQSMGLNVSKDANGGVKVTFDPAMIERMKTQGFDGFVPVILNITPVTNILPLLGLDSHKEDVFEEKLAGV